MNLSLDSQLSQQNSSDPNNAQQQTTIAANLSQKDSQNSQPSSLDPQLANKVDQDIKTNAPSTLDPILARKVQNASRQGVILDKSIAGETLSLDAQSDAEKSFQEVFNLDPQNIPSPTHSFDLKEEGKEVLSDVLEELPQVLQTLSSEVQTSTATTILDELEVPIAKEVHAEQNPAANLGAEAKLNKYFKFASAQSVVANDLQPGATPPNTEIKDITNPYLNNISLNLSSFNTTEFAGLLTAVAIKNLSDPGLGIGNSIGVGSRGLGITSGAGIGVVEGPGIGSSIGAGKRGVGVRQGPGVGDRLGLGRRIGLGLGTIGLVGLHFLEHIQERVAALENRVYWKRNPAPTSTEQALFEGTQINTAMLQEEQETLHAEITEAAQSEKLVSVEMLNQSQKRGVEAIKQKEEQAVNGDGPNNSPAIPESAGVRSVNQKGTVAALSNSSAATSPDIIDEPTLSGNPSNANAIDTTVTDLLSEGLSTTDDNDLISLTPLLATSLKSGVDVVKGMLEVENDSSFSGSAKWLSI